MPYGQTFETVTTLVRALLDEAEEPIVWTDTNLLPLASAAQRDIQAALSEHGVKLFEDDVALTVPAGTLELGYATSPALPDAFVLPYSLAERTSGATSDYVPMTKRRVRLSTYQQTTTLDEWLWKAGKIKFRGATTTRQVRIEYEQELPNFDAPDDPLAIPGSANAIAWRTIAGSEYARGEPKLMAYAVAGYQEALRSLVRTHVRSNQNVPVRRRSYSGARRVGGWR